MEISTPLFKLYGTSNKNLSLSGFFGFQALEKFNFFGKLFLLVLVLISSAFSAVGQTTVTAPTNGTSICSNLVVGGSAAGYTTLGNIVIAETADGDFAFTGTDLILTLNAPAGWQFNTSSTLAYSSSGTDITSVTTAAGGLTSSSLTINVSGANVNALDAFTIIGLQVQATTSTSASGDITSSSSSGFNGITASTNFGSLSLFAALTPTVNISANPAGPVCAGSPVTFTASATNEGSAPLYQWQINGLNVTGANSSTFTASDLTNGSVVTVVLTSNAPCTTTSLATSNSVAVTVNDIPATPTASNSGPICEGSTINLSTPAVAGATYSWTGPAGFSSADQNPSILNSTSAMAGVYRVTITVNGCTSTAGITTVVVNPIPATPTASNNGPVCAGSIINLTTPAVAGATYLWSGPNGFTSALQNPAIVNAASAMAGDYSVTVTVNGCASLPGTTSVIVNSLPPTPTASNSGAICAGSAISLSTPTVAGATYSWTGPNSFTSSDQNPVIPASTTAMAGVYSVTITLDGCTSLAGTTNVVVNAIPATPTANSSGPACVGSTINLSTAAITGATYSWTGPNSFVSTVQNPVISNATTAMAGVYSVSITVNGCTSAAGTTTVVVNAVPATPVASSNSAVCAGGTINLSTAAVAGATYGWSGPNGFSSTLQNPTIASSTAAMAGVYSLTITVNGCTSPAGTTTVVVNPIPATPTASSNTPVCQGSSINLTTPTVAGATYSWTGPNGFNSSARTPVINNATAAMAGTYSVTITVNGCTSLAGATSVVVNPVLVPSVTISASSTSICASSGTPVTFTATPTNGGTMPTYQWQRNGVNILGATGATYTTSSLGNPSSISVVLTSNAPCASPATATSNIVAMTVYTGAPSFSNGSQGRISGNNSVCPVTSQTYTAGNLSSGIATSYTWTFPPGFVIASQSGNQVTVNITAAASISNNQPVTVVASNPCGNSAVSQTFGISVNRFAGVTVGSNQSICSGQSINVVATLTGNATSAVWSAPSGSFSNIVTAGTNPITVSATYTPTILNGNVNLLVTTNLPAGNCTPAVAGTAQLTVTVNQVPIITSQPVATQTLCSGSAATFSVAATGTGLSYQWQKAGINIPGATSSILTLNNITTGDAGNYTVTVSGTSPCTPVTSSAAALIVNQAVAISTQPIATQTVCSGSAVNFTVAATGTGLTYQWRRGTTNIPGATSATLTINSATVADSGTDYNVVISGTGPCTPLTSSNAVLVVNEVVAITNQPVATQTLCSGSTASFSVTATGTGLSYQWRRAGVNIPGATSATLTLNNITTADAGNYTVVVTGIGPCTPVTSQTSALVVNQVVAITAQPVASQTTCSGSTVSFTVAATGTGLTYQWRKGTTNIAGATAATLTLNPVTVGDAASDYNVVVTGTGPCAPVTSSNAALVVNEVVAISNQPVTQTLCAGSTATFSVAATGTGLTYQWRKGGANIAGATSTTLTLNSVTGADAGMYSVLVTGIGPCAPVTSSEVALVVNQVVAITTQPAASQSVCSSFPVSFSVVATGTGLTYQWYQDGNPLSNIPGVISGVTSATLNISQAAVSQSGIYTVVVTGAAPCSPVTSANAQLTVNQSLTITTQPISQTLCEGSNVSFTVAASGSIASYVWRRNGIPVSGGNFSGANTATLTITGSSTANSGNYDVVVSGTGGSCSQVLSNAAILTVNANSTIVLSSAAGTNAQTKCINTAITNITYAIGGGTGASITAGVLPAGVTGAYSAGVFTISGTPTAPGIFNYTVTTTGPCNNSSISGTITVNDNSTITLSSAAGTSTQTVCIANAITNITYSIAGGGTGASITAGSLPAGVTGSFNAGVFTISGTPTSSGVFNYTVTTTGSPCINNLITGTITVNPNATIVLSSAAGTDAQTKCINTAITNITYTIGGTGASITGGALPAGVTGSYNAGVFTISGTPSASGTFNYTVTATGPCVSNSVSGSLTVTPNSTILLSSAPGTDAQTRCVNTAITNITYAIGGGGTGASITAGALPAGITGTFSGGVFTISGTPSASGIFSYTVTTMGPCVNNSITGTITVNPNATIVLSSAVGTDAQTKCINTAVTNITYAIGGTGASITAGALPAGVTGSYNAGVFTISGTPSASGTFNYTVTATGPCISNSVSGSLTVTPNSTISLSSAAGTNVQTKCINTAITNITYAIGGGGTGASITAGALPAGVTGTFSAGVFTISGTPTASGTFNYTVTTSSPCVNNSLTGTITVTAQPTATISYAGPFCKSSFIGTAPVTRTGTAGGTYNASPVGLTLSSATGAITPSTSTGGVYTITYTIAAAGGCSIFTTSTTVSIGAAIVPNTSTWIAVPTCSGSGIMLQATGTPTGGDGNFTYQWNESIGNCGNPHFAPGVSNQPTYIVPVGSEGNCYTLTISSGGCSYTYPDKGKAKDLVLGTSAITFGSSINNICIGSSTVLTASSDVSYTYSWSPSTGLSSTTGNTVTANPLVTTTYTVTATATSGPACTKTAQITVTVNPLATLSGVSSDIVCSGSNSTITLNGLLNNSISTITYNINGVGGTASVTSVGTTGSFKIPVTFADNGKLLTITTISSSINGGPGCSQNFSTNNSTTLIVNPRPTLGSISSSPLCNVTGTMNLTANVSGLLANSITTVVYQIGGGSPVTVNISADAVGAGSFQAPVTAANDGQSLVINSITVTANSVSCSINPAANNTLLLYIKSGYVWTGGAGAPNNNWNNAANWLCGIPPNDASVIIPQVGNGNFPRLDVDFRSNNFDLQGNATIDLNGRTLTLGNSVSSVITMNGSIIGSPNSELIVHGSFTTSLKFDPTLPRISNALKNLTFDCAGKTIDLANTLNVIGNIIPTAGTLASNGFLTMVSTATTTSNIGSLFAGAAVSGIVNVESWITGGPATNSVSTNANRGTRTMSSPVVDASFKQLQSNMFINGSGTGGFDVFAPDPSSETLYTYKEAARFDQGALAQYNPVSDINNNMIPGIGFFLFYRGDRSDNNTATGSKVVAPYDTPESMAITYKGAINYGDIRTDLSYTPNAGLRDVEYNGFNLVGNPYPSIIDWTQVIRSDNSVVENMVAIIRPGGSMLTYSGGIVTNGGLGALPAGTSIANPNSTPETPFYIQPGQGFYVRTRGTGSFIRFQENAKAISAVLPSPRLLTSGPLNQSSSETKVLRVKLEDKFNADETAIVFMEGFDAKFGRLDATYLAGSSVSMSSQTSDGKNVAINFMPDIKEVKEIGLTVNSNANGTLKMSFTGINSIDNYRILLKDSLLNSLTNLKEKPIYEFAVDRSNALTFGANRFKLVFEKVPAVKYLSFTGVVVEKGSQLKWSTGGEVDNDYFEIERSQDGVSFAKIGTTDGGGTSSKKLDYLFSDETPKTGINYYRLKQVNDQCEFTYSEVISLNYVKITSRGIFLYPNPASNDFSLKVDFADNQPLQINIYDVKSQKIKSQTFTNYSAVITQDISELLSGVYIVEVVGVSNKAILHRLKLIKQ
ncbi:T9SS type A sorting domain-containing protein [Flavihumibacter sp. R14]|nr:T9SS type A sorting domain-containing protein [Flavihumibacter soli]